MLLEALLKGYEDKNPIQKLVNTFYSVDTAFHRGINFSPETEVHRVSTKLDSTRGLIEELEKLVSKGTKQAAELGSLDLMEASRIFNNLVGSDGEEEVFLQALLDFGFEEAWGQAQQANSMIAEESAAKDLIQKFLVFEKTYTSSSSQSDDTSMETISYSSEEEEVISNSKIFDQGGHTKYENAFYEFMANVVIESSEDVKYNFDNVGSNLVFFMRCCAEPRDFERDYETECTELKKTYQLLKSRIEEIRKTTSEDTLALPINNFVRSIDVFVEAVLQSAYADEVLSGYPTRYKSISEVAICHDCLAHTYEILNDENVFVLGGV